VKFAFIRAEKAHHDVRRMCRFLEVSASGYYAWCKRPPSSLACENEQLSVDIGEIFEQHRGRYGSPRVVRELRARGTRVGRHRVRKLMKEAGLRGRRPRRWTRTTDSSHSHPIAPNLLKRNFDVATPNSVWVGDITYLPTREGWTYLSVLIDLYSRAVVGWSTRTNMEQDLTIDTLNAAIATRRPPRGLIVHSDRGVQYSAHRYRDELSRHGMLCSMSRKGDCWDNAVAESFFATLKKELVDDRIFEDHRTAKAAVFEYIEAYYNSQRRHSKLDYLSPLRYEEASAAA
jgi:transposase InsO family protein